MTLQEVETAYGGCRLCPGMWGGPVLYEGKPSTICFMAEALGDMEVKQKRPLIGPAGQVFNRILAAAGLNREDVFLMNTASCRPPNNKIEKLHIANCQPVREALIAACNPKVIVTLGATATATLCPGFKRGILEFRGRVLQYRGIPVVVTLHPSYVMRQEGLSKEGGLDIRIVNVMKRQVLSDYLLAKTIAAGGTPCPHPSGVRNQSS